MVTKERKKIKTKKYGRKQGYIQREKHKIDKHIKYRNKQNNLNMSKLKEDKNGMMGGGQFQLFVTE